jgi:UDP-N-acetylglucosamine 2-epimerase
LFEQTLQMCEQVWHRMRPGYVMVGYDFTLVGRTVVNYFQDKGVTTGCPMHGTLNPNRPAELFRADRLYLYGENHRRALIARGVPASRLLVTGSTQLDDVWPKVRRWAQRPNAAILGLAGGKPLALVALSGPGHSVTREHHRLIIAEIARGAAAFPRVHFVFKLHQKDNRGYYADVLSRYANTSLVSFRNAISEDIYEWIFHSTLLITGASSSAFEAMVLGKPVITLDLLHELPRFDFIERGVTLHVGERGRLVYFLESILGNGDEYRSVAEKANAYIANCFHNVSGASAADAMAADIVSVLEHRASICGREP